MDRQPKPPRMPPHGNRTVGVRILPVVVLAVAAVLAGATSASAHTTLIGMSPPDGGDVSRIPTEVVLTFNEAVQEKFATVAVTDDGGTRVETGAAVVDGAAVRQSLEVPAVAGAYTVSYRVVADDGHPITGTGGFRIEAAASPSAPPQTGGAPSARSTRSPAPALAGTGADDPSSDDGPATGLAVVGGIAVAGVAGAGALLRRRRTSP